MIQRIVNNFYLRNLLMWFLYVSPDMFQDIAAIKQMGLHHLITDVGGHTAFYLYFVFHSRVLYEKFLINKKYVLYVVCFFVTMFLWREGTQYLFWMYTHPVGETVYQIEELKNFNWMFWVFIYWADWVYSWFALGVYLAFKYFKERTALLEIGNMQKELELKQLNEQLSPHFLFNALNNIYSYLLTEKSAGKELILKLSELMRYVLDSSKKDKVELKEELLFIEHYIAFESERLGNRCEIRYVNSIQVESFNIIPLIMFTFIENAFKHGTASVRKSVININITAHNECLNLMISNTIHSGVAPSTKTGLNNAQRRLLLLYPNTHNLRISSTEDVYSVVLEIKNIP